MVRNLILGWGLFLVKLGFNCLDNVFEKFFKLHDRSVHCWGREVGIKD